jgi:CO dehydrogenase/acetyl-CoA synthase beta subunit
MNIFDDAILSVNQWRDQKNESGKMRCWYVKIRNDAGNFSGHKDLSSNIILKEDTHLELGHPSAGSASAALATYNAGLVADGRIALLGPDISEAETDVLPFAQIITAALKGNFTSDQSTEATIEIEKASSLIDRISHNAAQTKGYMIRSVPSLIWARVSKDAVSKGFSFRLLGERLIHAIAQGCTGVDKCEILFVTSGKEDVAALDEIIETARAKIRKLEEFEIGPEGEYACTEEQDCSVCPEQVVCNTIRDVIKLRKGDRVISFQDDGVVVRTVNGEP